MKMMQNISWQTVPEAIMAQVVDGLIPASSSLSATIIK